MNRRKLAYALFWLAVGLPVAFFLGQSLFPGAGLYTATFSTAALDWMGTAPKLLFSGAAALLAVIVYRRFEAHNPSRPAWMLLAAGLLGLFLGQATLTTYFVATGRTVAFPSFGDLLFVLGSLALVAALFAGLRAYGKSGLPIGGPGELWGLGLASAAISAVVVVPVLQPIVETPGPLMEKLLNLTYPALDFLMLIPALLLLRVSLRFRGGKVWTVWAALVAGILFTAAGDVLFAYFSGLGRTQLEALLDATYILAYGFLAGGVLYQKDLLTA